MSEDSWKVNKKQPRYDPIHDSQTI